MVNRARARHAGPVTADNDPLTQLVEAVVSFVDDSPM